MGQFSVEKPGLPGSVLSGNQQVRYCASLATDAATTSCLLRPATILADPYIGGLPGGMTLTLMARPHFGFLTEELRADVYLSDEGDQHLRSASEVIGYRIHAVDGEIGHVKNIMIGDKKTAFVLHRQHTKLVAWNTRSHFTRCGESDRRVRTARSTRRFA
jgi:hypothetical protein